MKKSSKVLVAEDVHKVSIDITLPEKARCAASGKSAGIGGPLLKMVRKQPSKGRDRVFVYDAWPYGMSASGGARFSR